MKTLDQYRIPFTGLKPGKHEFEFEINKLFFEEFEYSLVENGDLKASVILDKQETMMVADIHITGKIELTCDVCLNHFWGKSDILQRLIVKFDDEDNVSDLTDEIMILKKNEHELDLATILYEYITLSVPHYSRCEEQGINASCDQSMIDKLNSLSNQDNTSTDADPRWEILKKIKNNN
ncbi:DUF177 domain-containing protein [Olivibacter sp. CPCC 100613]|uniref:YceD family protein n=1 Tax=Olivibacter sp. CPCC 100613 TaxID=3079931 RepID=UPI002FFAB9BA